MMIQEQSQSPTVRQRVAAVFRSSRPISWVNTAFPFGAAYLLLGGALDWVFVVGVLFFLVPYNIAMYGINDVFDYESDIRNPRKGGVEGAVLSKSLHSTVLWAAGVSVVPFAIALYAAGTWVSALWLTVCLAAVYAYSGPNLRFKERPILDSITSSTHFVGPALVGGTMLGRELPAPFWVVIMAFFLWGMASHALGAVQDVKADRDGGLRSIATELGGRTTVRLAVVAYVVTSALLLLLGIPGAIVAAANVLYIANAARFWNVSEEESFEVHRAWKVFLWGNYLAGAVVCMTLIWVFVNG